MILSFSDNEVILDNTKPSIFLAGPTLRNSTFEKSWRAEAIKILNELRYDGIVYIPEFKTGVQFDYDKQVLWERNALDNSNKIIFWVPRNMKDMPGMTTNVEFGIYLTKNPEKVFLGFPENAEKMRYLEWLYN